jgi:hypothetical protein
MKRVPVEDQRQLTEAISHVLTVVSPDKMANALQMFLLPVAQRLHELMSLPASQQSEVATVMDVKCIRK